MAQPQPGVSVPILGDTSHDFTDQEIAAVPASPGVYELGSAKGVVYYGSSETNIRDRLQRHKRGDEGPCTQGALYFRTEIALLGSSPLQRERELLTEYYFQYGRLPECNTLMP
jgi:hypothetical protein